MLPHVLTRCRRYQYLFRPDETESISSPTQRSLSFPKFGTLCSRPYVLMNQPSNLASEHSEHLPKSVFDSVDVPKIYDQLGLDYERYILEDRGRAATIDWVVSRLLDRVETESLYVVDLGCASGRPTVETIANALQESKTEQSSSSSEQSGASRGHIVMGIDISPVQLEHARQRITAANPIAQFELADIRTWSPPPSHCHGGVDAVLSYYVVNHLPLEDYVAVLQRIAQWLKPGGVFVLGTVAGVNGRVNWMGYEVAATGLPLSDIVALIENAGCKVERSWEEQWTSATDASKRKLNQFVLATKP